MSIIDPQIERDKIYKYSKFIFGGLASVGLLAAGPWLFASLTALLGAALAGGALLATLAIIWNFAPVVADLIADYKIKAIVALAEANPIETMQSLYTDKSVELAAQDEAIRDFDTEFRNVNDLVDGLRKTDPEEAPAYAEMRDKMEEGLAELRAEQTAATGELQNFKLKIDKARRIYKVAAAMNKALAKSQSAQAAVFADIKEQVSFDKVRTDLNRAFANLNSAVERRKNASLFKTKETPKETITVEAVPVPQLKAAPEPPTFTKTRTREAVGAGR